MPHPLIITPVLLAALAGLAANGQQDPAAQNSAAGKPSAAYTGCLTRAGSSTVQQGMCAQAELTRQDARLNTAYKALRTVYERQDGSANLTDGAAARLRDEQRAWLADRDQVCRLSHDTVDNACLVQRESARADELEARLRNP